MGKYAVMGKPIAHSLSPIIHQAFAKQKGLDLEYERLEVDAEALQQILSNFSGQGGCGANVTAPLKEVLFSTLTNLSDRAKHAQAVNTISLQSDGAWLGDNTDGIGLSRDLNQNYHLDLSGKKILILGAGGATRGILRPLLSWSPKKNHYCQ